MTFIEIILMAAALSIDSFAVSMSGAVSVGKLQFQKVAKVSICLAVVQTAFFLGGFFAGEVVGNWVETWGTYIGFGLLLYVGLDMIREAMKADEGERDFSGAWKIIVAAVATSIDAVAVGASFGLAGFASADVFYTAAATFIATIAFAVAGMFSGSVVGRRFGKPAKVAAGVVLIAIGVNILL